MRHKTAPCEASVRLFDCWHQLCFSLVEFLTGERRSDFKTSAPCEAWSHNLRIIRLTRCLLRQRSQQTHNVTEMEHHYSSLLLLFRHFLSPLIIKAEIFLSLPSLCSVLQSSSRGHDASMSVWMSSWVCREEEEEEREEVMVFLMCRALPM